MKEAAGQSLLKAQTQTQVGAMLHTVMGYLDADGLGPGPAMSGL